VGRLYLGDGSKLTQLDRKGNNEADRLAKLAVEEHRVPKQVRDNIKELALVVERTARWVARATYAAGHQTVKPHRDTDASRAAAVAAVRLKALNVGAGGAGCVEFVTLRPVALDGPGEATNVWSRWHEGGKSWNYWNNGGLTPSIPRVGIRPRRRGIWPQRSVVVRRRIGKKKHRRPAVDVHQFLPQSLQPRVHPLTAVERRAAIFERVRAKEAAMKATMLPSVVGTNGVVLSGACRRPG
jgi:hypothetical protein